MAEIDSLFNEWWYLDQNPDVAEAVDLGLLTARQHFDLYGNAEGRSPGPLFNTGQYLAANPDVAAAVDRGDITAYDHFVRWGAAEGRSPLSLFDVAFYLDQNQDVAAAVEQGVMSATEHFLLYGQNERRYIHPAIDLGAYLDANADVATAVGGGQALALVHLITYGIFEGRDLGRGVDLSLFSADPVFLAAVDSGDAFGALARVAQVAPFLPDFDTPPGWTAPPDTPIPLDFVPPEGVTLIIPRSVVVPPGTVLPPTFELADDGLGTPDAPLQLTLEESPVQLPDAPNYVILPELPNMDTDSQFVITGGNDEDEFYAFGSAAVSRGLTLDGGEAWDALFATLDTAADAAMAASLAPSISNVEILFLKAEPSSGTGAGIYLSRATGIGEIWNDASAADLLVADVRAPALIGASDVSSSAFTVRYSADAALLGQQQLGMINSTLTVLAISMLGAGNTVASANITDLSIDIDGDNAIGSLGELLADSLKTIAVDGSGDLALGLANVEADITLGDDVTLALSMADAAEFNDWTGFDHTNTISGGGMVMINGAATNLFGTGEINVMGIETWIEFENNVLELQDDGLIFVLNADSASGGLLTIRGNGLDSVAESVELRGTSADDDIDVQGMTAENGAILISIGNLGSDTLSLGSAGVAADRLAYLSHADGGETGDVINGFDTAGDRLVFRQDGFGAQGQNLEASGTMSVSATASAAANVDLANLPQNFSGIIRITDTAVDLAATANAALTGARNGIQAILLMEVDGNTEIHYWNDSLTANSNVDAGELTLLGTMMGIADAGTVEGLARTGMGLDLVYTA